MRGSPGERRHIRRWHSSALQGEAQGLPGQARVDLCESFECVQRDLRSLRGLVGAVKPLRAHRQSALASRRRRACAGPGERRRHVAAPRLVRAVTRAASDDGRQRRLRRIPSALRAREREQQQADRIKVVPTAPLALRRGVRGRRRGRDARQPCAQRPGPRGVTPRGLLLRRFPPLACHGFDERRDGSTSCSVAAAAPASPPPSLGRRGRARRRRARRRTQPQASRARTGRRGGRASVAMADRRGGEGAPPGAARPARAVACPAPSALASPLFSTIDSSLPVPPRSRCPAAAGGCARQPHRARGRAPRRTRVARGREASARGGDRRGSEVRRGGGAAMPDRRPGVGRGAPLCRYFAQGRCRRARRARSATTRRPTRASRCAASTCAARPRTEQVPVQAHQANGSRRGAAARRAPVRLVPAAPLGVADLAEALPPVPAGGAGEGASATADDDRPLCSLYAKTGACERGEACPFVHGDTCPRCGLPCLHPSPARAAGGNSTRQSARRGSSAPRPSATRETSSAPSVWRRYCRTTRAGSTRPTAARSLTRATRPRSSGSWR